MQKYIWFEVLTLMCKGGLMFIDHLPFRKRICIMIFVGVCISLQNANSRTLTIIL